MVSESENQQDKNAVLKLIYEDANESLKLLHNDLNSINTRLTFLIGFNATFASLLSKLPVQSFLSLKYESSQEWTHLYPYAEPFLKIPLVIINWLLSIKPLIALFLVVSVTLAIWSILPKPIPFLLFPKQMFEQSKDYSEEEFRIGMLQNREEVIQKFENLISQKTSKLKYSLIALGGAALLTLIDILYNVEIHFN